MIIVSIILVFVVLVFGSIIYDDTKERYYMRKDINILISVNQALRDEIDFIRSKLDDLGIML